MFLCVIVQRNIADKRRVLRDQIHIVRFFKREQTLFELPQKLLVIYLVVRGVFLRADISLLLESGFQRLLLSPVFKLLGKPLGFVPVDIPSSVDLLGGFQLAAFGVAPKRTLRNLRVLFVKRRQLDKPFIDRRVPLTKSEQIRFLSIADAFDHLRL